MSYLRIISSSKQTPQDSFFSSFVEHNGYCYRNGNRGICRFPLTDHFISFRNNRNQTFLLLLLFIPLSNRFSFIFLVVISYRILTSNPRNRVKFEIISLFLFVTVFFIGRIRLHPCLREYRGKPFFIAAQTLTRYCEASSFHYKAVVDAFLTAENRSELVRTESEKLGTTYKVLEHA